jgi:hypothetical protein
MGLRDEAIRAAGRAEVEAQQARAERQLRYERSLRGELDAWSKQTGIPVHDIVVFRAEEHGSTWKLHATVLSDDGIELRASLADFGRVEVTHPGRYRRIESMADLGQALRQAIPAVP